MNGGDRPDSTRDAGVVSQTPGPADREHCEGSTKSHERRRTEDDAVRPGRAGPASEGSGTPRGRETAAHDPLGPA